MFKRSFSLIDEFVQNRHASAAVVLIGTKELEYSHSCGTLAHFPAAPKVTKETVFDLASVTKVVATTTAILLLLEQGELSLATTLKNLLPNVPRDKADLTLQQLLTHTAGLPQMPIFREVDSLSSAVEKILSLDLKYWPGSQVLYSCLGFILLSAIIERCTKQPFGEFVTKEILSPLGMANSWFNPPAEIQSRTAYTEWCPDTRVFLQGIVHDENCRAIGGAAGNAGLFSTVGDLAKFCQMVLSEGSLNGKRLLSPHTWRLLKRNYTTSLGEDRTLGWMFKDEQPCSGGDLLSRGSLGHTGFTGTSIWLDMELETFVILLTNRVHPSRADETILEFRPRFHNAVFNEIQIQRGR